MAETQKGFDLTRNKTGPRGRNYLLAIGIDEYIHCSKLNNAVRDAEALIALMKRRYNFEDPFITLIKNTEATKKRIEQEFIKLTKTITAQDNLVVYFSGHGRYDAQLGGNWVPVEAGATDDDWPDYLSNDLIKGYLNRINSFHTFLIADSCFAGALFIDKSKEKFTGDRIEAEPSRWGLTSGRREIVSDGAPGEHSPFATALLDVLEKADQPPGVMRICDLVLEKVAANAEQTPMGSPLAVRGHQGGQFVFRFRADENADWAEMRDTPEGCRQYLALYPEGRYRRQAEATLAKAEEEQAWQTALATKSVHALLDFEESFPQSARVVSGEVDRLIADLEEETLWSDTVRSDSITAFRDYLRRTRTGKFRNEANEKISIFRQKEEESAWLQVKNQATRAAYEKFLEQFPNGRHAEDARNAIVRLNIKVTPPAAEEREKQPLKPVPEKEQKIKVETPPKHTKEKPKAPKPVLKNYTRSSLIFAGTVLSGIILLVIWSPWSENTPLNQNAGNTLSNASTPIEKPPLPDMVSIKGGNFQLGSNNGDLDEKPVHAVTLSDFYMGRHEVTVEEFSRFVEATGYETDAEKNFDNHNWRHNAEREIRPANEYNHPVIFVSWYDAIAYCNWLSEQHGYHPVYEFNKTRDNVVWPEYLPAGEEGGYRLPTEAEWEYAARSRGGKDKWAGTSSETNLASFANFCDKNCTLYWKTDRQNDGYAYTAPVGSFQPNGAGLYDMSGNVWEWCGDLYGADYPSTAQTDPRGPASGSNRVIRGGSWFKAPADVRCGYRYRFDPALRFNYLGFRLSRAVR